MEIGPIVRSLAHSRGRFLLIAVEIALTLAIVANCLNMIRDQQRRMLRPTGLDEAQIIVVESKPFAPEFAERAFARTAYEADLRALRALPGVRAASATRAVPLSGGGSSTGRRASGTDVQTTAVPYFEMGTDALATLGVELVAGRDFIPADYPAPGADGPEDGDAMQRSNVIVTQALADALFPDGNALGQRLGTSREDPLETIVGIVRHMHCSWPNSPVGERALIYPGAPFDTRANIYLVRAESGTVDELHRSVERALLGLHEGRIVETRTLAEIKADTYRGLVATGQLLGGVSLLLVLVTGLGIVGLTSFSVTARRRQIGTRRALGATRLAILRYFLTENWIVTSFGLAIGVVLTYALNFALAKLADVPRMELPLVVLGMILLWFAGQLAAFLPALRGATVPPVVATRTV